MLPEVTILDPGTGFFQLSGFVAGPHSTSDLLLTHFGAALGTQAVGNWVHHKLSPQAHGGEQYDVTYLCEGGVLRRIQFTVWTTLLARPTMSDPWNPEKAQQKRDVFDTWLTERLGSQREFPWGSASAVFDLRSTVSFIGIKYAALPPQEQRA
jgi:hypothetical protein